MKATVTSPETWKKIIEVEIPVEDVTAQTEKKVAKYSREASIPGFRKGKVPTNIVRQRFGDSIRNEVIEDLMNNAYRDACIENKITPVSDPVIDNVKAEEGQPITFTAAVEIDPEIEIKEYKNLNVTVAIEATEDKDVNDALDAICDQYADFSPAEGAAVEGQVVTLAYRDVTIEGEEVAGFIPAPQMLEVGKAPIAELNDALKGVKQGDEKTLSVVFPADYRIEDAQNKKGEFSFLVTNVQNKTKAALTDEFVKEKLHFDSVDALKAAIRADIEKHKEQAGKNKAYDEVIDKILEKNDFAVPPARVSHYIAHIMKDEAKYYPNGNQPSFADYLERYKEVAEKSLKRFRILDYIATTEKVKATQEEVDARIKEIADQYNQPFETVKAAFRQNGTTIQIREDIKEGKALDCLVGAQAWPEN